MRGLVNGGLLVCVVAPNIDYVNEPKERLGISRSHLECNRNRKDINVLSRETGGKVAARTCPFPIAFALPSFPSEPSFFTLPLPGITMRYTSAPPFQAHFYRWVNPCLSVLRSCLYSPTSSATRSKHTPACQLVIYPTQGPGVRRTALADGQKDMRENLS